MIWKMISLRGKLFEGVIKNLGIRNIHMSKSFRKDHYEILGIKRDATQAEIKNAYFELSKIYHPDRIAGTDENLTKFRELSVAYEVLGNEQSRKLYDKGLIGEGKIGIDETEDSKDPLIKFYKQRQQAKMPTSGEGEMDAWTREFYKKARKVVLQKSEIFQAKKTESINLETRFQKDVFFLIWCLLFAMVYSFDEENSHFRLFVLNLLGDKSENNSEP